MDSDPNDVVKKRLHVAGLTPAVSLSDLSQRLGTFGTVIAVDGIGALDGLGRPRPFAYVTIEAKSSQLAKCACSSLKKIQGGLRVSGMNLLSGTTWKGGKLRIGEAKPDFRERYGTPHPCRPLPIDRFHVGSNARMRYLQTIDRPRSVVWHEAFKASTHRICPSLLLKAPLHDLAGTLHPWVGLFVRYGCGQRNLFHLCLPWPPIRPERTERKNGKRQNQSLSGQGGGLLIRQIGIHSI